MLPSLHKVAASAGISTSKSGTDERMSCRLDNLKLNGVNNDNRALPSCRPILATPPSFATSDLMALSLKSVLHGTSILFGALSPHTQIMPSYHCY